ncbi:MAG TPA: Gfo/Idh/MocA family oxidoreductase [Pirellulales bacterium]|nr:Gfo/Idh/MocA family oxidoreductase [Pirellulales bacterium]
MIRVGIVGIGFMGMIHYLAYQKARGAKVAAIATRDGKRLAGDWRGIQGNFGPPGTLMDLGPIGRHPRWQDLLADPKIDLVDICLPPSLHEEVAVAALAAGKHVLCEKPIALSMAEGKKMVQTAKRAGRQLLVGHVLPFFAEYAHARRLIAGGKYGKLLGGHFKRIISDPLWLKDFYDPRAVGGPVVDLHIHDAHFIRLICGMPRAVYSTGRTRGGVVEFIHSQFLFNDRDLIVTAAGGVIQQQGRGFTHAFEIYLERATLLYDFAVLGGVPTASVPLTVLTPDGKAVRPKLAEIDAFAAELTEAARSVRGGRPSEILSGELALDALALCHRETESVRQGRLVKI